MRTDMMGSLKIVLFYKNHIRKNVFLNDYIHFYRPYLQIKHAKYSTLHHLKL